MTINGHRHYIKHPGYETLIRPARDRTAFWFSDDIADWYRGGVNTTGSEGTITIERRKKSAMKRVNKIWSYQDLCFIRENYSNMTQFQLAYHFGVSESRVNSMVRRYGFRKYKKHKV